MTELLSHFFDERFVTMLARLGVAIACGLIIGIEREYRGKAAGLRTYMIICMGSCLFTLVSEHVAYVAHTKGITNADPGRIAAQVVTGIGFLGAGAIIRNRGMISGLTTAAGIWGAAAIGLASGFGMLRMALISSLGLVLTMEVFSKFIRGLRPNHARYFQLELELKKEGRILEVRKFLRENDIRFSGESIQQLLGLVRYTSEIYMKRDKQQDVAEKLSKLKGVKDVILYSVQDD